MKKFRVIKKGKTIYTQMSNTILYQNNGKEYMKHFKYFKRLVEVIESIIQDIDLILEFTDEYSRIVLYISEDEKQFANDIKSKILTISETDRVLKLGFIEQIGIVKEGVGVSLIFLDKFYEFFE